MAEFDDLIPVSTADPFEDLVPNKPIGTQSEFLPDLSNIDIPRGKPGIPKIREALAAQQLGDVTEPFKPIVPLGPDIQADTLGGQLLASPYNVGKGFLEGAESPGGIALLPLGMAGKLAQGALGAGFGIPAFIEGVKDVYVGTALGDRQRAIQGALKAITGGVITGGAVHGLTAPKTFIPQEVPPIIPPPKIVDVQPPQVAPASLEIPEKGPPAAVTEEAPPTAPAVDVAKEEGVAAPPTEPANAEPNVTPTVTQAPPGSVPPIIGMGGAASGEIPPTGQGADIYGVAERVRLERAAAGQTPQLEPGEGVSAQAAAVYGRKLLESDPTLADKAVAAFDTNKSLSFEGFASSRAKAEEAFANARKIEEEHGTDSNQYREAAAEGAKWDRITKDMQTEWHKLGQAQQGQTDLDTGTFTGLEREWLKQTGKLFTTEQADRARMIADESQKAEVESVEANQKLADKLSTAKFVNPESKKIWDYAKANYIDKGVTDFVDVVNNVSTDLGVSPADVRKVFAEPKSLRKVLDSVYEKHANRRRMVNAAKQWIQDEQKPGYTQFLSSIPRIWFLKTIAGHGTALHITHAPSQAVNPYNAAVWWKSFFQQWPFAYKKGYSEMMIQDAIQDPNFIRARRSGLQNDFYKNTGDYQTTAGKLKGMWNILAGTKGTDGLKVLRQRIFSNEWNQLPESLKTTDMANKIANSVNHMTGALTTKKPGSIMSTLFFAPQLEGSRWVYQYADSYKAGEIFAGWKNATPEEKYWATREAKQKAAIVGTYLGLLTANQGLLTAMGSDQQINFTDPTKSDWLSFKAFGHKVGFLGPMLGETRLLANMLKTGIEAQRKGPETRSDRQKGIVADYLRGKLSPFSGNVADVALMQSDYSGRPLPWSDDRVPAYLRKRGIGKYSYGEYAAQQGPIPFAEAAREVWEQQGVDKDTIDKWFKVLAVGAAATTGIRVGTDYNTKKP